MRIPASIIGYYKAGVDVLRTHKTLTIILVALSVAHVSGGILRGSLFGIPAISFGGPKVDEDDALRACTGMHTVFQDFQTIAETQEAYVEGMSKIFEEHENILRTPSEWKCALGDSAEPEIPLLKNLASKLPGWHVIPVVDGPAISRPVTFSAFSSVVGELQREYECKLVQLQDRGIALVAQNKDQAPGTFCCTPMGCMKSGVFTCSGPEVADSTCNNACPVYLTTMDLATRLAPFSESINVERQRSRLAVERALMSIRSADMHYDLARQLTCYQRASLDLRNEMSLTADAISCMPKIWDATTSLHDRKQ